MRASPTPGHVAESPHPQRAAVCAGVREGMSCTGSAKRLHADVHDTDDASANAVVRSAVPATLSA